MNLEIFPSHIFSEKQGKGVIEILDVQLSATAATNNQQLIAGVANKRIMVLSLSATSDGVAGLLTFKSASAGTNKRSYTVPANTVATPNLQEPLNTTGIFRTATGQGVFVDNAGAAVIHVAVSYVVYTP